MSDERGDARGFRSTLWIVAKHKGIVIGGTILFVYILTALVVFIAGVFKESVTPYNPIQQNVGPLLAPPSLAHLFGTDELGRDVFSRVVAAAPGDVAIGFAVVAVALTIGLLLGSFAGFHGGLLDEVLMRITDVFFAIPALILALAIGLTLGGGLVNMTFVLMVIWWPPYARLARGESLKVAHQNYIEAAKLSGYRETRIVVKHVIPNIITTILVYATLDIGAVILVYSGLSYLGLTVKPPAPDWGQMVSNYQDYLLTAPWLVVFPGFAIALMVVGFSVLGDGVRDFLEMN